jgi:CheY-like chemotaxis protein
MKKENRRHPHILVAEDDRTHQQYVESILHEMGFMVTVVSNGKSAVDKLKESVFDLVLMDINMPVMDGLQASKIISEMRRKKEIGDIPVIALTANQSEGDAEKCFEAGMDDYIAKSLWRPKWKPAIERILHKWLLQSERDRAEISDENVIDFDVLEDAREILGAKLEAFITSYTNDSKYLIDRMETLTKTRQPATDVVVAAWTLAGSSNQMGTVQLAQMADKVARKASEMAKEGRDSVDLMPMIHQTRILYIESCIALQTAVKKWQ